MQIYIIAHKFMSDNAEFPRGEGYNLYNSMILMENSLRGDMGILLGQKGKKYEGGRGVKLGCNPPPPDDIKWNSP